MYFFTLDDAIFIEFLGPNSSPSTLIEVNAVVEKKISSEIFRELVADVPKLDSFVGLR